MRKLVLSLVGSTALAFGSAANAGITIGATSGLAATPIVQNGPPITVSFTATAMPTNAFSAWFDFTNDAAGLYNIVVSSSTSGEMINDIWLQSSDGLTTLFSASGSSNSLNLNGASLGAGEYRLAFDGSGATNAAATGNFTFYVQAVPEPATWALMLLGFAGVGFAMRFRRRPVLAQLA
ncbi:MAG: FxDxF family PEP-CTERM protein [Sphingomicrobium sp.]|jgi:hypothetical protein